MLLVNAMSISKEFSFLKDMQVSKYDEDDFQEIKSIVVHLKDYDFNNVENPDNYIITRLETLL